MTVTVVAVQAGGYTAAQDRQERAALLARSAGATVRSGILPSDGTDFAVTALVTPNGTVNVAKGQVVITDAAGGAYLFTLDAVQNTDILTAHPANGTNPRIDLVIARVYDNEPGDAVATTPLALAGGGTANVQTFTGKVEMVTGIPGAIPAVPALPNSRCVILKQVTIPALATTITAGMLADTGRVGNTAAAGGIIPCRNSADYPATGYPGWYVDDAALGYLLRWSGTAWVKYEPPRVGASCSATGDAWATDGAVVNLGNTGGAWTSRADSGGYVTAGSTPTPLTIPAGQGGQYLVTAQIVSNTAMTGLSRLWIQTSGTLPETNEAASYRSNMSTGETNGSVTALIDLQAGDTIGVQAALTTGGAKSATCWLTATRIGK